MPILIHDDQPLETWREGVTTRMRVSVRLGGRQLCIFEQFCNPGLGAPTHEHAVEEVLEVIEGEAEFWLGDEQHVLRRNQSALIPAGMRHGFRNMLATTLHVRATLASPIFEARYDQSGETSRRWRPGL